MTASHRPSLNRLRGALLVAVVCSALTLLAAPALAAGGTVSGKVDATPEKYLAETVVYLKEVPGTYAPRKLEVDQKNKTFIPFILIATQGDTVEFLNHDTMAHNVFSPDNETYNLGEFKAGESRTYTFKQAGVYSQLCSLHPEMLAYIFVGQNPYAVAVDAQGRFTLKDVPPGSYEVDVWNSHLKAPAKKVTVTASQTAEANFSLRR